MAIFEHSFRTHLEAGRLPPAAPGLCGMETAGLNAQALSELFESQLLSRHLDLAARRFSGLGEAFYSIGSAGHEGNAAVARALRLTDMAFLHYRSGAFFLERARQAPGQTPLWDMALSFVAAAEDPCSGGRHKVIGSKALFIPPQTSTIASHLPKAVGTAFAVTLARRADKADALLPHDAVIVCSFGDASANHSTAQGAFNTAAWCVANGLAMPILFVCEDNGLGISVPTPDDWIEHSVSRRAHLTYVPADGRDVCDVYRAARVAVDGVRTGRAPVFLHMKTHRLMGHAGSDVEGAYRDPAAIEAGERDDPLLHTARRMMESGAASRDAMLRFDARLAVRVDRALREAAQRPKLTSAEAVRAPVTPPPGGTWRPSSQTEKRQAVPSSDTSDGAGPLPMGRMVAHTLGALMAEDSNIIVFGEDVGVKGGVYGATQGLHKRFGPTRVFDSPLDEQSILGAAMGLAHNGFLPIPEIQFLAYVHNAEDQIRGEAATLSFFSNGQFANPMVIRIAGLGYQRGFGGHFHNDNALGVFRDVPGLVLACPSSALEAARMLPACVRLAREEGRVVVFLEPIALYPQRDLYEEGDGLLQAAPASRDHSAIFGAPAIHEPFREVGAAPPGPDTASIAIVTYGNGVRMARRAARRLALRQDARVRVVDLRWLVPLDMDAIMAALGPAQSVLIVDECRKTGSLSEELMARLVEAGWRGPLQRLCGGDSFTPLGPASRLNLPSEADVCAALEAWLPAG